MGLVNSATPNKPTVAILLGAPFTSQNYERTGIPYLKENFEVVVLDCNPWLRAGYRGLRFTKHPYPQIVTITSAKEFEEAARNLKPGYAIDFVGYGPSTRFIQKTLRMQGTKYVLQATGTVPIPSITERRKGHLAMAVKNPRKFFARAIGRLSRYLREWRELEPDIALLAGRKSLYAYTSTARSILWIASNDYYTYKNVQDKIARQDLVLPVRSKYALFIDDCIALASDYSLLGISPPVEPEKYHALLRQALDRLEQTTGLPVVVAAHPNGREIEGYASLFGDRPVYFDLTAELCSQSELVLAHASTALSYAALWTKPLIILTSRSLDKSNQGAAIREIHRQFQCPFLFMESTDATYAAACQQSWEVNVGAYRSYIDSYIATDEVVEEAPWQAFTNFVNLTTKEPIP